jgi:hypothetical protein
MEKREIRKRAFYAFVVHKPAQRKIGEKKAKLVNEHATRDRGKPHRDEHNRKEIGNPHHSIANYPRSSARLHSHIPAAFHCLEWRKKSDKLITAKTALLKFENIEIE